MRGNGDVLHCRRSLGLEAAVDLATRIGGFRQFFQGQRQTLCFQPDREEAPRQLPGFGDGQVQVLGYSTRLTGLRPALDGKLALEQVSVECRSEERRVGKECRSRWSPYH